jgi:hypothetical protein
LAPGPARLAKAFPARPFIPTYVRYRRQGAGSQARGDPGSNLRVLYDNREVAPQQWEEGAFGRPPAIDMAGTQFDRKKSSLYQMVALAAILATFLIKVAYSWWTETPADVEASLKESQRLVTQ